MLNLLLYPGASRAARRAGKQVNLALRQGGLPVRPASILLPVGGAVRTERLNNESSYLDIHWRLRGAVAVCEIETGGHQEDGEHDGKNEAAEKGAGERCIGFAAFTQFQRHR